MTEQEKIHKLRQAADVMRTDGNWNYCAYMRGYANGIILALSIFEETTPEFLEEPEKYISDGQQETAVHP